MKKQTIYIKGLIETVNSLNANSRCTADTRNGWNSLLEGVLFATDNYAGFGYYTETTVPKGCSPGIIYGVDNNGNLNPSLNTYPDESRRFYYVHGKLRPIIKILKTEEVNADDAKNQADKSYFA